MSKTIKVRRKPDWSLYRRGGKYPLHVLCALSLDIDPDDIDLLGDRDDPSLAEFWRRLEAAKDAVSRGELKLVGLGDA
jgi:hypothetical protein